MLLFTITVPIGFLSKGWGLRAEAVLCPSTHLQLGGNTNSKWTCSRKKFSASKKRKLTNINDNQGCFGGLRMANWGGTFEKQSSYIYQGMQARFILFDSVVQFLRI